ncbi:GPCR kinase, partial [Tanacetum coccineum]
ATDYVNANGGIVSRCLGDIKKFLNRGKLDQVVTIVKYCSPNVMADLTVTMKDLSGTIPGTIHHKVIGEGGYGKDITVGDALILANVSVFSPKPSMHYLNITKRNVVKVFRKDTVPGSESGSGKSEPRWFSVKRMRVVKFLSMKLATVNPEVNIDIDRLVRHSPEKVAKVLPEKSDVRLAGKRFLSMKLATVNPEVNIDIDRLVFKYMEKVINTYKVGFVINLSELGEDDPLSQNTGITRCHVARCDWLAAAQVSADVACLK